MDTETRKQQRRDTYQFRVNTLLTLIGLWLALPTTCAVLQRMADTLASLNIVSKYADIAMVIKFIIDLSLLCFYGLGIVLLLFIGGTGWIAHKATEGIHSGADMVIKTAARTADTIGSAVTGGTDLVMTTFTENKPKVQTAIREKIPEIQGSLNTMYGNSKTKMGRIYATFKEKFPTIGRFLDRFGEPF